MRPCKHTRDIYIRTHKLPFHLFDRKYKNTNLEVLHIYIYARAHTYITIQRQPCFNTAGWAGHKASFSSFTKRASERKGIHREGHVTLLSHYPSNNILLHIRSFCLGHLHSSFHGLLHGHFNKLPHGTSHSLHRFLTDATVWPLPWQVATWVVAAHDEVVTVVASHACATELRRCAPHHLRVVRACPSSSTSVGWAALELLLSHP